MLRTCPNREGNGECEGNRGQQQRKLGLKRRGAVRNAGNLKETDAPKTIMHHFWKGWSTGGGGKKGRIIRIDLVSTGRTEKSGRIFEKQKV